MVSLVVPSLTSEPALGAAAISSCGRPVGMAQATLQSESQNGPRGTVTNITIASDYDHTRLEGGEYFVLIQSLALFVFTDKPAPT
jgi:hypothetical protein